MKYIFAIIARTFSFLCLTITFCIVLDNHKPLPSQVFILLLPAALLWTMANALDKEE